MRRSLPIVALVLGTLAATPALAWDYHRPPPVQGWRPAPAWQHSHHYGYGRGYAYGYRPYRPAPAWRESWHRPAPPAWHRGDQAWGYGRRW